MSAILIMVIICSCLAVCSNQKNNQIKVLLTLADPDDTKFPWNGYDWLASMKMIPVTEKIIKYSENYKIKETYFMALQSGQYYYNLSKTNEDNYKKVLGIFKNDWYENAKKKYIDKYIDCIVTVCILENIKGEEYVVIDENNDEDLSNDHILSYSDSSIQYDKTREVKTKTVKTKAEIEYYDGKNIYSSKFPISFRKRIGKMIHPETALLQMQKGEISIKKEKYPMAIFNFEEIEYNNYNFLWIDSNRNSKADSGDCMVQMINPFTFKGKTYQVTEIERFGKYIVVRECDATATPPIEVGSNAPNFSATTLDSMVFKLSNNKGKFLLIDFWATWCGPCLAEVPYLKIAYDQFKSKNLEIISIGIDDPFKLKRYVIDNKLNWIHIQQNKNGNLEKLYQVTGYPTTLLVDKKGKIISIEEDLRGENLIKTLEKYIR